MNEEIQHKFDENLRIILKNGNGADSVQAFHKVAAELEKEGNSYSINRESFIRFFNELSGPQQREFLTSIMAPASQGRSVYDVAQEYKLRLLGSK